ncbi:MAG: ribonuclease HII [Thermoplasmatales archaeon]
MPFRQVRCGCDEAGRGPVIGPMVIAVVCGDDSLLHKIGVKDSKKLSQKRREYLFGEITKVSDSVDYTIVSEEEIDRAVLRNELNVLEARIISRMIRQGMEYVIDCPDVNEVRFSELLINLSGNHKIRAEHKADEKYPTVSAASIVAKVIREREIDSIKAQLGDFGSGYPSDKRTVDFLRSYYEKYQSLPSHVRRSWKTINLITGTLDLY